MRMIRVVDGKTGGRGLVELWKYAGKWMVLCFLFATVPCVCNADDRDHALEALIHGQLEKISVEAVDYFIKATQAMDNGDHQVARYNYGRVLEYAPDFVPALRRMSYVVDDGEKALRFARRAYELEEHQYNTQAVLRALLIQENINRAEVVRYVELLMEQAPEDADAHSIICQASLQIENVDMLKRAVASLKQLAPREMVTHYYAGIEAAIDKRWGEAEREILKAQELGLPADVADDMLEASGIRSNAARWRWLIYAGYAVAIWAAALVLLLGIGMLLSRLTLFAVEKGSVRLQKDEKGIIYVIRRMYATVLGLTSAYFYISIPIVILLVIAGGGGLIYSFFMMGHIPVKLVVIIVIVVAVSVFGMIKSLFIRVRDEDPGPRLEPSDAPSFFKALREVSSRISAPMVDSVFIMQDTSAAVYERGSFWKRLGGKTEKCLILGLGLLNGLTQVQLKSILAHEFGHISNRDTAGGSIALHVRRTIFASAKAMAEGGAAAWYNPAWLFINAFYRIFLRVSQGASRLQEVLADQWAALAYGSRAFTTGLKQVIRRSIEYNLISHIEINQAIQERRHLKNLYVLKVPEKWPELDQDNDGENTDGMTPAEKIEAAMNEAMKEQASPFDSHPAPQQRIRWVESLENVPEVEDDGRSAWELLENAKVLQEMMINELDERVQEYLENNEYDCPS